MQWNELSRTSPFDPAATSMQMKYKDDANTIAADIVKAVNHFNSRLDDDYEVGLMLASFGQTVTVNISAIGYEGAKLIRFIGNINGTGAPVELFQHVSQLNFLLISLPRHNKEVPKKQIGFIAV